MIHSIYHKFHNLSFQKKILLSFVSLSAFCLILIFLFVVPQIAKTSEQNILFSARQALDQAQEYIDYRMNNLRQTCYSIAYDEQLINIIARNPAAISIEDQIPDIDQLHSYLRKSRISHAENVTEIRLYINDDFVYAGETSTLIRRYSQIENAVWFPTLCSSNQTYYYIPPQQNSSSNSVSLVHMISDPLNYSRYIGAVILDSPQRFIQDIVKKCAVTENSYAYLINDEGIVVTASNDALALVDQTLIDEAFSRGGTHTANESVYTVRRSDVCDWTLVQVIPSRDIWNIRLSSLSYFLLVCLAILILSILLSLRLSTSITRRINLLSTAMRTFRYGNAEPIHGANEGDEIDHLLTSYNQLIADLEQLEDENIKKGKQLNETELALLHSQIKPHFLFNTLDMIRSLADRKETQKVSAAMKALSGFYRAGLGKHPIWSTLQNELEHIQSYMAIQELRFGDHVKLDIHIAPELLDINLPRITLQPIVENALLHGIMNLEDQTGVITISAQIIGCNELHLYIKDNGCGMSQDTLISLFQSGSFGHGIGLRNTNERIRIHYGNDYGLSIQSMENEYTEIMIRIPILRRKELLHDNLDR